MPNYSPTATAHLFNLTTHNLHNHAQWMGDALIDYRARTALHSTTLLLGVTVRRIERLWEAFEEAMGKGDTKAAAALAEVARRYQEMSSKYTQQPGFREQATTINAPKAQILVMPSPPVSQPPPAIALLEASQESEVLEGDDLEEET